MSAPATGLAEYAEARRKELVSLRNAYFTLQKQREATSSEYFKNRNQSIRDTTRQVTTPRGHAGYCYDRLSPEQANRLRQYETMMETPRTNYSAKLPRRFNNVDYISQW